MTKVGDPTIGALKPAESPGRFDRIMSRLFMRSANIQNVETVSEHFSFINFEGDAVKEESWSPGQKIQIPIAGLAKNARTFTPIFWSQAQGAAQILAYAHGQGPGSDWIRTVKPGDSCLIFGPRRSLDVDALLTATIMFGDETCFGLAASFHGKSPSTRFVFEVSSEAESRNVLERIGLADAKLVKREADDVHLLQVQNSFSPGDRAVLAGKAPSIQYLSRNLKQRGFSSTQIHAKAYWAPGKVGLD